MALKRYSVLSLFDTNLVSFLRHKLMNTFIENKNINAEKLTLIKKDVLKAVRDSSTKDKILQLLIMTNNYLNEVVDGYNQAGYQLLLDVKLKLKSRLLIGANEPYLKGLFDVGLSWDPLLNLPYIPASSIKGVFSSSAADLKYPKEAFGGEKAASELIFVDSYPVDCDEKLLDIDIITPHYIEVEGSIKETEAKPRPILFLVVARGVVFRFIILQSRRNKVTVTPQDIIKILTTAIELGFGAKTSLSYGRFVFKGE